MTSKHVGEVIAPGCSNLRQGAVVDFSALVQQDADLGRNGEGIVEYPTPLGVAVLSQTCDIVQETKTHCLVAPVIVNSSVVSNASIISGAKKGRSPLHLYLADGHGVEIVADMGLATSVPKSLLEGKTLISCGPAQPHEKSAREVGDRISRAFERFPFPDEVYPFFNKLRSKVQSSTGKKGSFSQVLDLIRELRVSADQWARPDRNLTLYAIVDDRLLRNIDDLDLEWVWSAETVSGLKSAEVRQTLSLSRVCDLLIANRTRSDEAMAQLWQRFAEAVEDELLTPHLNDEVVSCHVEVLSESDLSYKIYKTTESLDLEVLSHSNGGEK